MATLSYLWKHRAKFSPTKLEFYKAWAKRVLTFQELLIRSKKTSKLVKKGAKIDKQADIGEVSISGKLSLLTVGAQTFIGKARFALTKPLTIGNNVCINDEVVILTGSHDIFDPKWPSVRSEVRIDDYAWIGTGALIMKGVHIGRGAVVGARAVVSKSVKPGEIVVGNPAKPLNKIRDIDFDYSPCEFLPANMAWLKG